jgi:hypothetical protein
MRSTQTCTEKYIGKSTSQSTKSTKILLQPPIERATMKATSWSSNDELMPTTDDHRLQDIFSRPYGSTAQSSDSASALELGKYNHLRETYVLGDYE